ncbi:MAG: CDP-alcohol phosphatidyltransferase family protein [SAR202 cluster bacterium]|nr:CDP-alcohol phosphatidyltransferase family protein [SAR202 cluster bacterium]|tara:strand:- start:722 stop:1312 length:591 start_codon:yes stop_codon:yes gene_type:complete
MKRQKMDYRNYIRNNILDKIEKPIVTFLHKLKISPNLLSVFGLILGIIAAVFIALDDLILAALFLIIGAIADLFDGSLARKFNKETDFGAFLDSVIDRVQELSIFIGATYLLISKENYEWAILPVLTLGLSFLVSYSRARGEGLGIQTKDSGIVTRPERLLILIIGLITNQFIIAMMIVSLTSLISFIQRVRAISK